MLATLAREALPDDAVVDVVDSSLTARPLRVLAPLPVDPTNSDGDALTGFARSSPLPAGALLRRLPPHHGVHHLPPVRPPAPSNRPRLPAAVPTLGARDPHSAAALCSVLSDGFETVLQGTSNDGVRARLVGAAEMPVLHVLRRRGLSTAAATVAAAVHRDDTRAPTHYPTLARVQLPRDQRLLVRHLLYQTRACAASACCARASISRSITQ